MLWVYIVGAVVVLIGVSVFFGAPYVPSHKRDVRRLFQKFTPISESDTILDLGSGDGVVLREASRHGARAIGYEIHPLFVLIARWLSWGDANIRVQWANAWTAPFPRGVTLVYAFAVGRDGKRLTAKVQHEADILKKPLTLVCYGNALPGRIPERSFEAYHLYIFHPLHRK
ncbi:MAG: class I SAM-dependent methyltransferase [Candidatus Microsaccharimonas sp.]